MGTHYWSDMAHEPTCVYRLYDWAGNLLYVGITMRWPRRLEKHRRRSWWSQVANIAVEWLPNRTEAKNAERRAISEEDPVYNITRPRVGC